MKIVKDFFGKPGYRKGVWACPFCDWGTHETNEAWEKTENVREIVIRGDAPWAKTNSVMVSSECPNCFEVSFHHFSFDFCRSIAELNNWPEKISKEIEEEKERRLARGKEIWDKSFCKKCSVKHSVSWDCYYPYVTCSIGRHGSAETEKCDRFKKKRKRP